MTGKLKKIENGSRHFDSNSLLIRQLEKKRASGTVSGSSNRFERGEIILKKGAPRDTLDSKIGKKEP